MGNRKKAFDADLTAIRTYLGSLVVREAQGESRQQGGGLMRWPTPTPDRPLRHQRLAGGRSLSMANFKRQSTEKATKSCTEETSREGGGCKACPLPRQTLGPQSEGLSGEHPRQWCHAISFSADTHSPPPGGVLGRLLTSVGAAGRVGRPEGISSCSAWPGVARLGHYGGRKEKCRETEGTEGRITRGSGRVGRSLITGSGLQ